MNGSSREELCFCIRIFRETEPIGERERLIYYKELAHAIMEADKSQDLQAEDPEELMFQFTSKGMKKNLCVLS